MIGHAVSNVVPIVASNRIGTEHGQRFYGHSFICDERGDILAELGAEDTGVLVAEASTFRRRGSTGLHSASSGIADPNFTGDLPKISRGDDPAPLSLIPQGDCTLKHVLECRSRQSSTIRVLTRAMIARQQNSPVRGDSFGAVPEFS